MVSEFCAKGYYRENTTIDRGEARFEERKFQISYFYSIYLILIGWEKKLIRINITRWFIKLYPNKWYKVTMVDIARQWLIKCRLFRIYELTFHIDSDWPNLTNTKLKLKYPLDLESYNIRRNIDNVFNWNFTIM